MKFIKLPEVIEKTGLKRSTVYARVKDDPDFPKPVNVGVRAVAWVESDLDRWMADRVAMGWSGKPAVVGGASA